MLAFVQGNNKKNIKDTSPEELTRYKVSINTDLPTYESLNVEKEVTKLTETIQKTIDNNEKEKFTFEKKFMEAYPKEIQQNTNNQGVLRPIVKKLAHDNYDLIPNEHDYIVEDISNVLITNTAPTKMIDISNKSEMNQEETESVAYIQNAMETTSDRVLTSDFTTSFPQLTTKKVIYIEANTNFPFIKTTTPSRVSIKSSLKYKLNETK